VSSPATLDRAESVGEVKRPSFSDPSIELLQKLGIDHEQRFFRYLSEQDGVVVLTVDTDWERAVAQTTQAIRDGVAAIYQGAFWDGNWGGRPDFLVRVDQPSKLLPWGYEVIETKLAHSTKANAVMQLCFYSDLLARIQGVEPGSMHIVLGGTSRRQTLRVQSYAAFFRRVRSDFEQAWASDTVTYPEPTPHCDICSWSPVCKKRWMDNDYLSLVAGISRKQRKALSDRGVTTMSALARLTVPVTPKIERIGTAALQRIRDQARVQVQAREEKRLIHELLEGVADGDGLSALPQPSSADMFLDFEGNPYVFEQGLEYLFGIATLEAGSGEPTYEPSWCLTQADEKKTFECFIAKTMDRWRKNPDMHIYHYAPYEPNAIKRLVGRYGIGVEEVDELLRARIFVDLYRITRQSVRASVEDYSIKRLEPFYECERAVPLHTANRALSSFEAAMALGDNRKKVAEILSTIEGYNRDDCLSLIGLRGWLEKGREELEIKLGHSLLRPTPKPAEPSEEFSYPVRRKLVRQNSLCALQAFLSGWA
jgi:uncharacterized protein